MTPRRAPCSASRWRRRCSGARACSRSSRATSSASSTPSSARSAPRGRRTATSMQSVHGYARRSSGPSSNFRMTASCRTLPPPSSMPNGRSSSATGASSMQSATEWLESLSPWPRDGFGLGRMTALLDLLDHPERTYDAVHVVGTKGKSTATRTIAALLRAEGHSSAAYTSPHVAGWGERLETDAARFEQAIRRVRAEAEALDATQFEVVTAAALVDFAQRGV